MPPFAQACPGRHCRTRPSLASRTRLIAASVDLGCAFTLKQLMASTVPT